jgi:hypothetical protein
VLNEAFSEGLLSEQTLSHRLELLFGSRLIEPHGVVGDLALRTPSRRLGPAASAWWVGAIRERLAELLRRRSPEPPGIVLALDWSGGLEDLVIGRGPGCDISLGDRTVSRRHARLVFRDGSWIVQDLGSRNGIALNGARVGRCQLHPGDRLSLGLQLVEID